MKQLLRICLTGAFFLLFEGLLSPMLADNGKSDKEILVLNSINFNLPWARNFYWYVHDVLQEQGRTARAESLSVPALQDTMEVNAVIEHLRQKYPLPPAAAAPSAFRPGPVPAYASYADNTRPHKGCHL